MVAVVVMLMSLSEWDGVSAGGEGAGRRVGGDTVGLTDKYLQRFVKVGVEKKLDLAYYFP